MQRPPALCYVWLAIAGLVITGALLAISGEAMHDAWYKNPELYFSVAFGIVGIALMIGSVAMLKRKPWSITVLRVAGAILLTGCILSQAAAIWIMAADWKPIYAMAIASGAMGVIFILGFLIWSLVKLGSQPIRAWVADLE